MNKHLEGGVMRFNASKTDLLTGINIAIRAVPSHTTMDILECILVQAESNELIFTATDMEMGIETHVRARIEERGIIAVDAKMLYEIIRKLPEEIVFFESDENYNVRISSGKANFLIGGRSGDEFSGLPSVDLEDCVTLSQYTLKSVIQETIFSISTNENSKVMTGELFEIRGSIFRVIALDGHRIAIRRVALKDSYSDKKVIVPGKCLQDLCKILPGEVDEIVSMYFSRNHIVFEIPGTRIVSRLIDGEYYNVDQMISSDYETKVTINKNVLFECIDRANLFVKEGDKKPIIFEIDDDEMSLSIDSPLGSMNEVLDIQKEGKNIVIGFNPRFMMDVLKAISDEEIVIYLVNPKAPCFIKNDELTYTYLVLPVNFVR